MGELAKTVLEKSGVEFNQPVKEETKPIEIKEIPKPKKVDKLDEI